MRKLLLAISTFISFSAYAQENTLLTQTFWQGSPDVNTVKTAVDNGANPSQMNAMSMDPVVMAINAQAPEQTIEYLLAQKGNSVDKLTHDGRTYLHWAANRGNVELLRYLIGKGAKVNIQDSHGTTPLTFAASSGQQNTAVYDLLISAGASLKTDLNGDGANVLLLAVSNDKKLSLTDYFVAKGLSLNSVDADGNTIFSYAAKSGDADLLKAILQKGVKPQSSAMLMAAQGAGGRRGGGGASLAFYQYLESLNINPAATNKGGENALHYLVKRADQTEIIKYFLAKGADVNQADQDGNTVLINAATANRDTTVLALIIPKVKNINQGNQKGATALALAMKSNSPAVVRYLIGKGADVNVLDKEGYNLGYYLIESFGARTMQGFPGQAPQEAGLTAAPARAGQAGAGQGGRPAGVKGNTDFDDKMAILKEKGFNFTMPQKNGNTLYHLAVAKNNPALFERIQPLGIDINAKNKEGLTALHKAALVAKNDTLLKYLIAKGAAKDALTNYKESAFDLASENESLTKNNVNLNFLK